MMNLKEFRSVHVTIVALSQQLPEGTGENHKKLRYLLSFPTFKPGALSCLVIDICSDEASEIFSKYCLFAWTWTTFFFRMSFSTRKA